jgi:hypothetical protein
MRFLIPALLVVSLAGCASMSQGAHQNITVLTVNDKNADKTQCKIKNEEGVWTAAPNSATSIHRDGNEMEVICDNDLQTGIDHISPRFESSYLVMDIILIDACIISCIIDGANNAFYSYPESTTVTMKDK